MLRPTPLRKTRPSATLRRVLVALVMFGALAAACSGAPAPEDAATCEDLVKVGISWVERTAAALEGQPLEVVTGDAEPPEDIAELQSVGAAIDVRAADLGCATAELNRAIATAVVNLESDDPVVSLFLRLVQANAGGVSE